MAAKTATADDVAVGARITELRKATGLSQKALAEMIGVTFQQVQKYEKGKNRIGASRLQDIAKRFGVPVSALYGDENEGTERNELLVLYSQPGAANLLKAFLKIENAELRRNVLAILSTAARISTGPVVGKG